MYYYISNLPNISDPSKTWSSINDSLPNDGSSNASIFNYHIMCLHTAWGDMKFVISLLYNELLLTFKVLLWNYVT